MEEIRYNGNWEILGKEYFGVLIINDKKGIIRLILHNRYEIEELLTGNGIPSKIEFIKGKLFPYGVMTLLNATMIKRSDNISSSTATRELDIEYCINYDFIDYSDIKFYKVAFRLSNTLTWSGLNGLTFKPKGKSSYIYECELKDIISYNIDENTTINFVPCFYNDIKTTESEETIIKQFIEIEIVSKEDHNLDFYIDTLNKIKSLIELSINKSIDTKKIEGYRRDYYTLFDDNKWYQKIEIYSKDSYKENYDEPNIYDMIFSLSDITKNDSEILKNWFSKYELLEPIIGLYNSCIIYSKIPSKTVFLNIVQALETYHSRFICDKKCDYEKRVNEILKNVPSKLKEAHYEELFDKTQQDKNTNYIILKSRLNDLMLANFDIVFFNMSNDSFPYNFVKKVVDTRHYYTHYSKSKKEKIFNEKELPIVIRILRVVLLYYILKEIGFEKKFIDEEINKLQVNISYSWDRLKNI